MQIAPECSGYEGVGLMLAFVGGYLILFRRGLCFPQALLLLPLGAALIWLANAGRIVGLILIGSWWSPEVAAGGFHSQAGWLTFNAIALGLIVLAHQARFFAAAPARAPAPPAAASTHAASAYVIPLLTLVAVSMATAAVSTDFDWLYPVHPLAVAAVLWYYRHSLPKFRWSWTAVGIGAAVFGLWLALVPVGPTDRPPAELSSWPAGLAAAWVVFRILGASVTVPLAEELAFRGYRTVPFDLTVPKKSWNRPSRSGCRACLKSRECSRPPLRGRGTRPMPVRATIGRRQRPPFRVCPTSTSRGA
jgi:exosortase E/protease (VPEID-CTERM system)